MTLDDIIRMAREAGFGAGAGQVWAEHREGICTSEVERLVALAYAAGAAEERERRTVIDWGQHKYGAGVEVEFAPRAEYRGRPAIPELLALAGTRLLVRPLWLMDEHDLYPGEWALGNPDHRSDVIAGRFWIASGDVKVLPKPMQQWPRPEARRCNSANSACVSAHDEA
jgi:hypothetical protein